MGFHSVAVGLPLNLRNSKLSSNKRPFRDLTLDTTTQASLGAKFFSTKFNTALFTVIPCYLCTDSIRHHQWELYAGMSQGGGSVCEPSKRSEYRTIFETLTSSLFRADLSWLWMPLEIQMEDLYASLSLLIKLCRKLYQELCWPACLLSK